MCLVDINYDHSVMPDLFGVSLMGPSRLWTVYLDCGKRDTVLVGGIFYELKQAQ